MLLDMTYTEYIKFHKQTGKIYPDKTIAHVVQNPWRSALVRQILRPAQYGYDYLSPVDEAHSHLYAFNGLHDGVDVEPFGLFPIPVKDYFTGNYLNINGYKPTCAIYEVQNALAEPKTNMVGHCWININNLTLPGLLVDGRSYLAVTDLLALEDMHKPKWDATRLTVTVT